MRSPAPVTRTAAGRPSSGCPAPRPATGWKGRASAPRRPPTSAGRGRRGRPGGGAVLPAGRQRGLAAGALSSVAGCVDVDPRAGREDRGQPSRLVRQHPHGRLRGRGHPRPAAPLAPPRPRPAPRQLVAGLNGANEVPGPATPTAAAWPWSGTGRVAGLLRPRLEAASPRPSSPTSTSVPPGAPDQWWCCSSTCPSSPGRRRPPSRRPWPRPPGASATRTRPCSATSAAIRADYYANVHPLEFLPGAIRGQLPPPGLSPGGRAGPRSDGRRRGPSVVAHRGPGRRVCQALGHLVLERLCSTGCSEEADAAGGLKLGRRRPGGRLQAELGRRRLAHDELLTLPVTVIGKASTNFQ